MSILAWLAGKAAGVIGARAASIVFNPYLLGALALCALLTATYLVGRHDGKSACENAQKDTTIAGLTDQLGKDREAFKASIGTIERRRARDKAASDKLDGVIQEIQKNGKDRNGCGLGADDVRLLNTLLARGVPRRPGTVGAGGTAGTVAGARHDGR